MAAIEAKLDVLISKMSTQEKRWQSTNTVGIAERGEYKCMADEGLAHEVPN